MARFCQANPKQAESKVRPVSAADAAATSTRHSAEAEHCIVCRGRPSLGGDIRRLRVDSNHGAFALSTYHFRRMVLNEGVEPSTNESKFVALTN